MPPLACQQFRVRQIYDLRGRESFLLMSQTNAANEITSITGGWVTPVYDAAGNMISGPKSGDETTGPHFKYDAWSRQVAVDADDSGEPVLVEPKTLLVPPELEATADSLYASTNVVVAGTGGAGTTAPSASPFADKYQPLCSPYTSNTKYAGASTRQWYLVADPHVGPAAFSGAFLNGRASPVIEQAGTDFITLGIQFRGYLDFAFAQGDPQEAIKSAGDRT